MTSVRSTSVSDDRIVIERSTAARDVDRRRDRGPQFRQQRVDAIDRRDDVGAGRPVDDDEHRRFAVGEARIADVLDAVDGLAHVGQPDRRAVAIGDDERTIFGGGLRLVVVVDLVMEVSGLDRAFRAVGVRGRERRPHVFEPDAVFVERARIELDPHRRERAAADRDLADPVDLGQLLRQHRGGGVVELALAQGVGRQGEDQDRRVRRIDLAVGRVAAQARRQVGMRRIDRRLHVPCRAVDVAVEAELQVYARRADGAGRRHFGDVRDLAEMALQRRGDAGRDHLGTCTGKLGPHRDGREVDLRQRRHRQLEERDGAGGRDPEREQDGRDRPPDEGRRQAHSAGLPCSASRTAASTLK